LVDRAKRRGTTFRREVSHDEAATDARGNVNAERWTEAEGPELARGELALLLFGGLDTPEHRLFEIEDDADGTLVGFLWLGGLRRGNARIAFVYQIAVFEPYRGRGHAKAALRQVAALAAADGYARMQLHVFRHNTVALRLYASVGFETASLSLTMPLSAPESNPSRDDRC